MASREANSLTSTRVGAFPRPSLIRSDVCDNCCAHWTFAGVRHPATVQSTIPSRIVVRIIGSLGARVLRSGIKDTVSRHLPTGDRITVSHDRPVGSLGARGSKSPPFIKRRREAAWRLENKDSRLRPSPLRTDGPIRFRILIHTGHLHADRI